MTKPTNTLGRTARRLALLAVPLLVAATGTAAAHGGESYGGGMMGGGWGLFGGAMGLWGLLWMGLLIAVPLYLVYALLNRETDGDDEGPLSVLRERYARGELSDDEFERRREQLERAG
ncbi:SHOCT domain-containing protein [Haloarcula nitratireducens]|uniref:SHOCT domain-containing protein n=1 Tax=Haloarcula nitratireducens TaxID=2487749 RepID=A0AAW4PI73_9EURY|nr:SHOCT domain-containing protein [Halomicroarcula nitratireducens]MBX0297684.1 SHOCT domain-containing protein [Halomicroarcula nitratireducens]